MFRAIALISSVDNMLDATNSPVGYDFITFWSAGYLALEGVPEAAFIRERIVEIQQLAVPGNDTVFLWHYPPTFMLLTTVLAAIPYLASYFLFIGGSFLFYVYSLKRLFQHRYAILLIVAYPAVYLTMVHGQNSLLSTGLLACAIVCFRSRPVLAGVFIGLLAFKPQLGVLIPLVLIVSQQWRVFWSAAVTTGVFVGLSLTVFGWELWDIFFQNMSVVKSLMGQGFLLSEKMPSLYITLKMIGFGDHFAYVMHWGMASGVVGVLMWLWYRCGPTNMAFAALIPAILLILPYLFDYEMTLLAIPIALLAMDMADKGGVFWEKAILVCGFVTPLILAGIGQNYGIQIGFPVIFSLFILAVSRAVSDVRKTKDV
ncbi:glycosyltransferase family 87 protein [Kiloniella majae]|uniref:glycosyltransferase family 87 protein n=1 Tax=Kiloniella majae TaxID=1938558 RepID=UPI000F784E2B|nr:glycosyltransferase family 87 protein [Kiloniella majae]